MHGVATVTETVSCHPDGRNIVVSSSATFTPTYAADNKARLRTISIRRFEGSFASFADSDANFSFYDDGRLKSVNQTATGQGETIVKSLVSLGTSVSSLMAADLKAGKTTAPCDGVKGWTGASKPDLAPADASLMSNPPSPAPTPAPKPTPPPQDQTGTQPKGLPSVTLTYTAEVDATSSQQLKRSYKFEAAGPSKAMHTDLKGVLPAYSLEIAKPAVASHPEGFDASQTGPYVNLELQKVNAQQFTIKTSAQSKPIFQGDVFVPSNESYFLPIPAAALFGVQKLSLTVAESGLVTQIDYGKNSGLAGAANAANTIVQAVTPESTTAKASDIKAQADVLAQQARLHRCLASPSTCQ